MHERRGIEILRSSPFGDSQQFTSSIFDNGIINSRSVRRHSAHRVPSMENTTAHRYKELPVSKTPRHKTPVSLPKSTYTREARTPRHSRLKKPRQSPAKSTRTCKACLRRKGE